MMMFTGYFFGAIGERFVNLRPLLLESLGSMFVLFVVIMLVAHHWKFQQSDRKTLTEAVTFFLFVLGGAVLGFALH